MNNKPWVWLALMSLYVETKSREYYLLSSKTYSSHLTEKNQFILKALCEYISTCFQNIPICNELYKITRFINFNKLPLQKKPTGRVFLCVALPVFVLGLKTEEVL